MSGLNWLPRLFESKESKRLTGAVQDPEGPAPFDPDAALARYLETKAAEGVEPPSRPAPGGFGRKGA